MMRAMKLFEVLLRKCVRLVLLLIGVSLLSFMLVKSSPIDPVRAYIGADMMTVSPEQLERISSYWGLDRNPLEQFVHWMKAVFHGDLGTSMIYRTPVADLIAERLGATLLLTGGAWILSGILGFMLGVFSGLNTGTFVDKGIRLYCYVLASSPGFWVGLLFLMFFAVHLGWFPVGLGTPAGLLAGEVTWMDRLHHVILPIATLSILGVANVALHTREKVIEIYQQPFIQFAKGKGMKGLRLFRLHGFRSVLLPAVSMHFASFGEIFGGAIVAEQVFSYPGMGKALVEAGLGGDVPLLLGMVLASALFVFVGNLLADVLYIAVDPRLRKGAI
ncbi:ABC transporter permease [Sporosarcina sp. BI001-red]|uniref:ABC transporter permease n=1 Tax=Sporosarcina sp. BI001-red TaxID=2282866 RepID=UPI003519E067